MAQNSNTGLVIPPAAGEAKPNTQPAPGQAPTPAPVPVPNTSLGGGMVDPGIVSNETQPRDFAIGGGVLLVLLVAFFFAKNAYANHLARQRVPHGAATAAGWWLFIFLASLATASMLAIINSTKFLTPLFMAPLGIIAIAALVLMLMTGKRS